MYIRDLIKYLETLAPVAYQESYDNSGLLVGEADAEIKGILLSLDCTEAVVEEAIQKGCNVIVAHHPIIFKGLKKVNGTSYIERTVIKAIQNHISIYAIHTNLDHVPLGVNGMIAQRLGLRQVRILAPKREVLMKLTFFVPEENASEVLENLYAVGAGHIGNYSHCSFQTTGVGTFKPNEGANPYVGEQDKLEKVTEQRVEVIFSAFLERKVMKALRVSHPYEEVAYYLHTLSNENQEVGAGAIGELEVPMDISDFLAHLKTSMQASVVKYTLTSQRQIKRVAVCGGAGSFLLPKALAAGADAFVTSDFKYHEFFDAENRIMICDIGHYESEVFTKQLLFDQISKKFNNFALYLAETNTNPVSYFY
jgi:dinuclear metal center YbgI/SA1388 family protein